jgi:hypothetical protein
MKPLSPEARRLFELSRGQDEPDAPARMRVGRALSARIAAGAAALGSSASTTAVAAAKSALLATATKSVLLVVAGALVTTGWLTLRPSHHAASPDATRSKPKTATMTASKTAMPPSPGGTTPASPSPELRGTPSPRPQPADLPANLLRAAKANLPVREGAAVSPAAAPLAAQPASAERPDRNPRLAQLFEEDVHKGIPRQAPGASPAAPPFEPTSPVVQARPTPESPGLPPVPDRMPSSLPAGPSQHLPSRAKVQEIKDLLFAETEALRSAQQALRDRKPRLALELLDKQDVRFRDGVLAQERAAARVLALCQSGRVAEAQAQAARFERLWPRSPLKGRVHSACWER